MQINNIVFKRMAFMGTLLLLLYNVSEKLRNNFNFNALLQSQHQRLFKIYSYFDTFMHNGIIGFSIILFFTILFVSKRLMDNGIDFKKYYIRLVGIYSVLFWLSVLLGVGIERIMNDANPKIFSPLFFISNFDVIRHGWSLASFGHCWQISILFQVLLLLPVFLHFVPKHYWSKVLVVGVLLSFVFKIYCLKYKGDYWMVSFLHTVSYLDIVSFAVLIALYFDRIISTISFKNWIFYTCVLSLIMLLTDDVLRWETSFEVGLKRLFYVITASALFFYFIQQEKEFWFDKIANTWYSFFVFQVPVISLVLYYFRDIQNNNPYLFLLYVLSLITLTSLVAHYFIFNPLKTIVKKI